MNKKMSKRQRDIKSKLMAAISMLLVSSIMMVSSTYAWFTLSTAPEVTGVTTAVGANGNLEMALLPNSGDLNSISSEAGDSNKPLNERNVTWGNLVDLSLHSVYGLDKITMYPSELNATDGTVMTQAPLKFPTYGADGRINELVANTTTAVYGGESFTPGTVAYGVRAVGTASGMTERQLSYRNARGYAATAMLSASKLASESLDRNGDALAGIAMKKGTGSDSFTAEDVNALKTIVNDLTGENGVFAQIEKSYMQYILAVSASSVSTDIAWMYVKGLVEAEGATLNGVVTALQNPPEGEPVALPDALTTGIAKYNEMVASVDNDTVGSEGAKQLLDKLTTEKSAPYTWKDISDILTKLANIDNMKINDYKISEVKDNLGKLIGSISGGGINVVLESGGGVYADIADQTENFTADVTIRDVEYQGTPLGDMDAKMKTNGKDPSYLKLIGTAVEGLGAPASGEVGSLPISDMYGYIIDMAFRTNAAGSNLKLQVEATDRIYSTNENGVEVDNESTMGNGANMTFNSLNASFSNEKVIKLMNAIRIVFFNPDSGEIVKYAKLDTNELNIESTTDGGVKANLMLCDLSDDGKTLVEAADQAIMELPQNTAVKLSVLVYLDGNQVTNADVASSGTQSVVGQLNLQFASDANLTPMNYTPLVEQGGSTGNSESTTESTTESTGG